MIRNHPDRREPLAQGQFRILKDRPDLDRKTLTAIAALEGLTIREVINPAATAVRAKLSVSPSDSAQMVDARLLVRKGVEKRTETIKSGEHAGRLPIFGKPTTKPTLGQAGI